MRIKKWLWITVGASIAALALNLFLVPNRIAPGGVSGLATVLHYVIDVPVGAVIIVVNVPLLLLALKDMGWKYALRSLYGFGVLGILTDYVTLPPATDDLFLASLYGGLLMGTGLGIVLRAGGNTGGTDLVASIVRARKPYISMGGLIFVVDFVIVTASAASFGLLTAMYALVALYMSTKVIDMVVEGLSTGKAVYIISDAYEPIAKRVMAEMERGVTKLEAKGMYSGFEKGVLLCILKGSREVAALKHLVREMDSKAFVFVYNVKEVLGEGFSETEDGYGKRRTALSKQRTN